MKKLFTLLFIILIIAACNKVEDTAKLEIINDSPVPIQSIILHYYLDGKPISTEGAMNADNSFMEKADSFVYEILPDSEASDKQITIEIMAEREGEPGISLGIVDITGYEEGERLVYKIVGDSFESIKVTKN